MSKKVYIRVDKPIEVGDLVRCVENDFPNVVGDIRKVNEVYTGSFRGFFAICTNGYHVSRAINCWEPVHKLAIGDQVVFEGKDILTVKELSPDAEQLTVKRGYVEFKLFVTDQLELYQPEKHDPKPTLGVDIANLRKAFGKVDVLVRRKNMKSAIAEMIVELLDRDDKENCPQSSVLISNWREFDNTVTALSNGNEYHAATLSPSDTWDTLTGVYVALSKATGRKLPDWIYGDER